MPVTYEPWLVLLSIGMAIQGAYVGLSLAAQISASAGVRRRVLLAGAAFSLAVAIWTMHFVGMLAVRVPFQVDYLVFPTLLSFLVCVIVVGTAVYTTSAGPLTLLRLSFAGALMGVGIFTMHYIGMTALHASAHMIHNPLYVAASLVIAIAASALALWLATGRGGRPPLILSAIAFGIAVSGMHYTAMGGLTLFPFASAAAGAPALSVDLLAIVVSIVAFCLSGIFLLLLMPDTQGTVARADPHPASAPPAIAAAQTFVPTDTPPEIAPSAGSASEISGDKPEFGRGSYGPLGGAGAPPKRLARHLPIERDGGTHFVAVDDVVAIHANAHYTYVFDGTDKLFCPLAIGDVQSRLDDNRFVRIHRSHIINVDRVIGFKRSGDSELVELKATREYTVPVSRGRIGSLKSRVAVLTGANPAASRRRRQRVATQ